MRLPISIASICPRAYAYGIDLFIRLIFLAAVSSVLGALGKLGGGLMLLIMFGLEWFYPVVLMFLTRRHTRQAHYAATSGAR